MSSARAFHLAESPMAIGSPRVVHSYHSHNAWSASERNRAKGKRRRRRRRQDHDVENPPSSDIDDRNRRSAHPEQESSIIRNGDDVAFTQTLVPDGVVPLEHSSQTIGAGAGAGAGAELSEQADWPLLVDFTVESSNNTEQERDVQQQQRRRQFVQQQQLSQSPVSLHDGSYQELHHAYDSFDETNHFPNDDQQQERKIMIRPINDERVPLINSVNHVSIPPHGNGTDRPVGDASTASTLFNVVNLYVGLGLLSKGYAVANAGWSSILAMILSLFLFFHSARLIVKCFDRVPPHLARTYPNLGLVAAGSKGGVIVATAITLEFIGAVAMCFIITWDNLILLISPSPALRWVIILTTTGIAVAASMVRSFANMSWVSLIGFVASIATVLLVILWYGNYRVSKPDKLPDPASLPVFRWEGWPVATGIFVLSLSGHGVLPQMFESMRSPEKFTSMLVLSFGIMGSIYTIMCVFAYLLYGENNHVLITTNLAESAESRVELTLEQVVTGCVAFGAWSTIPPSAAILTDSMASVIRWFPFARTFSAEGPFRMRVCRAIVVLATALLSYAARDELAAVEALLGGVASMLTALVFPAYFYIRLFRHELSLVSLVAHAAMCALGVFLMFLIAAPIIYSFGHGNA